MRWEDFEKTVTDVNTDAFQLWIDDPTTTSDDVLQQLNLPQAVSGSTDTTGA